jgi:ssDNA-binding Zn-finger/Zn-ribbon topoisomerase 1
MERETFNRYREQKDSISIGDGEHTIVHCPKCKTRLLDIWQTRKNVDTVNKITIQCGHCNAHTGQLEVKGQCHYGHTEETNMVNAEIQDVQVNDAGHTIQTVFITTAEARV